MESSDAEEEEDDGARSWDSTCPEPFPWDGTSSLMVCVDGKNKIWYQANVVMCRRNQYLLAWPG